MPRVRSSQSVVVGVVFALSVAMIPSHAVGQLASPEYSFVDEISTPHNVAPPSGQEPVLIAIVDDAFRTTHHDLTDFIWVNPGETPNNNVDDEGNGIVDDAFGWDVSDHDNNVSPPDDRQDFYHGTHIAGIVTRIARTAYGDSAPDYVRIMPVKALSDGAPTTNIRDGYKGIEFASRAGADIIIASWGIASISPEESRILQDAADKGALVVASGGNLPQELEQYPAAHPAVLAVGSIERSGQKTVNSNYGQFLDLSAPGTGVRSADILSDDSYAVRDGTSFSAAMVAAAAAMIKLEHPALSSKEIEACLKNSSDLVSVSKREFSGKLGAGSLNIERAVACDFLFDETEENNSLTHPKGFIRANRSRGSTLNWTIEPQGEIKGIRFTSVVGRGHKAEGRIDFRAENTLDAPVVASYSLDELPKSIFVPGTTIYVTLEPRRQRRKIDWLMEYEAETINFSTLYCRGTREIRVEGELTDGSGPEHYSANTDCKWLITAPPGKAILFQFDELNTEANTDLIYFFNGAGTHEKIMAIFSGDELPPELTTWRNQVLVWFVTNGQNQGKGWRAKYNFVDR